MASIGLNVTMLSQMPLALEIARRFESAGTKPFLLSNAQNPTVRERMDQQAAAANVELTHICDLEDIAPRLSLTGRLRWLGSLIRLAFWCFTAGDYNLDILRALPRKAMARILENYYERSRGCGALFDRMKPLTLIVFEDNLSTDRIAMRAAQKRGIRVIDCPYEISGPEDFERDIEEKYLRGDTVFVEGDICGGVIKKHFPHWIKASKYGPILPFHGFFVLLYELAGIAPRSPWIVHCGTADVLAAESPALAALYERFGCPRDRISVAGSVYADVLTDVIGNDRRVQYAYDNCAKIDPNRTSVLISLPASYHETRPFTSEFNSYEALLTALRDGLVEIPDCDFVISIHPSTAPEHQELLRKWFPVVTDQWLLREMPRHDIFLTSFSSSLRWAVAARRPVLNYDAYKFRLNIFSRCRAVTNTESLAEAMVQLRQMIALEFYRRRSELQKAEAPHWAIMDGHNFERLKALTIH